MNYLDIILAIPLLWGLYKGFTKGLIIEVASLIALGFGIYGAVKFSDRAGEVLSESFQFSSDYMPVISFAITFIAIVIGIYLAAKLLEKVINFAALKLVNKITGALFGFLKFGLILSVLLVIVESFDRKAHFIAAETKEKSILYRPVLKVAPTVIPAFDAEKLLNDVTEKAVEEQLNSSQP